MKLKQQLFLIALLIISVTNAFAQISFDSPEELEKAANDAFDAKQYEKAKPLFSQLLSLNALNANYNYRFGVCILYTEADPLKPLPYIEGGASTDGVNPEAFYFLGKAYQVNYRFDDAINYFQKGQKSGYSAEGVDFDRCIQECRNGKLLYNDAIQFDPAQDKEVIEAEFYRPYDFRKLKGKVIPMPPNFKTKYDEKNLKGTFVYTPSSSQALFYASYGEDGANAKDLYRVNRLPNGEWALPLRLPDVINTKYDEDFAFFDDETQILYFASKGHNTMGGYDVFKSVYNAEKNEWSQPINLQFPINSPWDDFLYVSDPDGKVAFFTSKRATEVGKIRVFKTLLHDPSKVELSIVEGTYEDKTDSIYNYMLASVIDPKTNQVVGKYRSNKETGKYVLILPPQNDYTMDVGPREAAGFKFDLDVPQHEPTKPLEQSLAYDNSTGEGTVTLTNYFDAAGKPDSVSVVKNRPKEEVEVAMVDMPDPTEILAARKANLKEKEKAEQAKLAELAAAEKRTLAVEKARQDSLFNANLLAEVARKDSIAKAEQLALKQAQEKATADSLAAAEAAKAEALAAAQEKAIADSIARIEELALEAAVEREKFVADSISMAKKEAERLAAERQKVVADSIAEMERLAQEKAVSDSLAKAQELALMEAAEQEQLIADSLAKAEQVAAELALAKEKAIADSIAEEEERIMAAALEREQFVADSIAREEELAQEIAIKKARLDSLKASLATQVVESDVEEVVENTEVDLEEERKRQENLAKLAALKEEKKLAAEREKAVADSIANAEEMALKAAAEREKFVADSIAKAEELALKAKLEREKIAADSISKAEELALAVAEKALADSIVEAEAEKERLAQIEREVEEAKARALKDSVVEVDVAQADEKEEASFEDILKEMQEKEAEILAQEGAEKKVTKEPVVAENAGSSEEMAQEVEDSLESKEVISEADLFLQTIANLEQQKLQQEQEIAAENAKAEEERKAQAEAKKLAAAQKDTAAIVEGKEGHLHEMAEATGDSTVKGVEPVKFDGEPDLEVESLALKSEADPNAYLATLAEIEAEMELENKSNSKSYQLQDLTPKKDKAEKDIDPVLAEKLEEDRKVIEEHQRIAAEKEAALKEQMQRDRQVVENVITEEEETELADIEAELLEGLEKQSEPESQPSEMPTEVIAEEDEIFEEKQEEVAEVVEVKAEEAVELTEEEIAEVIQPEEEVVETTIESEAVEPEVLEEVELELIAEADKVLQEVVEEASTTEVEVEEVESASEAVEEVVESTPEPVVEAEEELVAEADEVMEEILKEEPMEVETSETVAEEKEEVAVEETVLTESVEETTTVNEVVEEEKAVEISAVKEEVAAAEAGAGRIHLLDPALRDYGKRKADFSGIENKTMKRMVQRMRAEDVGRLAVLKNMKNQWVDAGKTQESLKEIKSNTRNQDVLAVVADRPTREERVREPFDKNDLRERENVFYKLDLKLTTAGVSETVSNAMTPEQSMTFFMPEFQIATGYFTSLADAEAEKRYYKNRGFEAVQVVAFHNGEQISLSDVASIPFVD